MTTSRYRDDLRRTLHDLEEEGEAIKGEYQVVRTNLPGLRTMHSLVPTTELLLADDDVPDTWLGQRRLDRRRVGIDRLAEVGRAKVRLFEVAQRVIVAEHETELLRAQQIATFKTDVDYAVRVAKSRLIDADDAMRMASAVHSRNRLKEAQQAELDEARHDNALLAEQIQTQELLARLRRTPDIEARRGEAHEAEIKATTAQHVGRAAQHVAEAEESLAKRDEARHKRPEAPPPQEAAAPPERPEFTRTMRENLARNGAISRDRRAVHERIDAILASVGNDERRLNDDQFEELDRLRDSFKGTVEQHRKAAASDLEDL